MLSWFRQLDELLRGRKTRLDLLADGQIQLPLRVFVSLAILLGVIYGFFMGWFGALNRPSPAYMQVVASAVKLPGLFLLTLVVTFPSLYVFNALVGCRLTFDSTLRLLVAAIVINVCVAASLGPILGFFTVSTTSYAFMVLLNVVLLGVAGVVSMAFLLQTLRRMSGPLLGPAPGESPTPGAPGPGGPPREEGPLDRPRIPLAPEGLGAANLIFQVWIIIYGLVGLQMGWLLRPFIGTPTKPFEWFRGREGNVFEAIAFQLRALVGLQ